MSGHDLSDRFKGVAIHPTANISREEAEAMNRSTWRVEDKSAIASIERGTTIGAHAWIESRSVIGAGCNIGLGAACNDARLGNGVQVHDGSTLHEGAWVLAGAIIGAGATIGSHALICEGATIGAGAYIGESATVASGIVVGRGARIDSFAIVRENVPAGAHVKARPEDTHNHSGEKPSEEAMAEHRRYVAEMIALEAISPDRHDRLEPTDVLYNANSAKRAELYARLKQNGVLAEEIIQSQIYVPLAMALAFAMSDDTCAAMRKAGDDSWRPSDLVSARAKTAALAMCRLAAPKELEAALNDVASLAEVIGDAFSANDAIPAL